ncbi:hypothetical protein WR25_11816 [Diploscapter pachys]|uniref:C2H2-type domain-containing protein n=1 Tax=Diploscapter pachys TaxID=2018661 RepID=A0A2A2KLQ5_9BILA|nr:hypothetical protein WR25_11816 [Diploscapter pachys]
MSADPSTGYTCVACQLVFTTSQIQKEHYKTEWHRYNLKRQAAELSPITQEQFELKAKAMKNEKEEQEKSAEVTFYCGICKKQMKTQNAYNDHIGSKKHKEIELRGKKGPKQPRKKTSSQPTPVSSEAQSVDVEMQDDNDSEDDNDDDSSSGWMTDHGTDDEDEAMELDESQALSVTSCLFCPQTKSSKEESLEHMRYQHGFAIPDKQYLEDEDGLLKYLGLKVGAGRCCIFCPDKRSRFASLDACQKHMRDKAHCKLRRDPESMIELEEFYDYSPMYENENEASTKVLYDDGWSLTLPSGAKIGHRALLRYYKQYLRPKPESELNEPSKRLRIQNEKTSGFYRALTWTGAEGKNARQAAKDIRFIERYKRRFDLRVGCRSNKLFKTGGRVGDN